MILHNSKLSRDLNDLEDTTARHTSRRIVGISFSIIFLITSITYAQTPVPAPKLLPFQGRLTNSQGNPVEDGTKLIQFMIYDTPTGSTAVWTGEVHRTSVNGGLVNVILGSKNSLSGINFNQILYLEITVNTGDDQEITVADPPLLPRQAILPVIFATESANSRNSNKLANRTWASLLVAGNDDPETGRIAGSKIADGSIGLSQLAVASVGTEQIADSSITESDLASNSITASKIGEKQIQTTHLNDGTIQSSHIQDGAITATKIGPANFSRTETPIGVGYNAGTFTITGVTTTFISNGRPVMVGFVCSSARTDEHAFNLSILRDGVGVKSYRWHSAGGVHIFPMTLWTLDTGLEAGVEYEYTVVVSPNNNGTVFSGLELILVEL